MRYVSCARLGLRTLEVLDCCLRGLWCFVSFVSFESRFGLGFKCLSFSFDSNLFQLCANDIQIEVGASFRTQVALLFLFIHL